MSSNAKSPLVSAIIASILSLVIFATLRFLTDWFIETQLRTIIGGYLSSWLFVFSLTAVSNIEMIVFGNDFQAKFIPEIAFCLSLSVMASAMVHRVCVTTCILFSLAALYLVNRISTKYYAKSALSMESTVHIRKGGKKNKQN